MNTWHEQGPGFLQEPQQLVLSQRENPGLPGCQAVMTTAPRRTEVLMASGLPFLLPGGLGHCHPNTHTLWSLWPTPRVLGEGLTRLPSVQSVLVVRLFLEYLGVPGERGAEVGRWNSVTKRIHRSADDHLCVHMFPWTTPRDAPGHALGRLAYGAHLRALE